MLRDQRVTQQTPVPQCRRSPDFRLWQKTADALQVDGRFIITVKIGTAGGLITPLVGMNVFGIKPVGTNLSLTDILKGVFPFVLSDIV